MDPFTIAGLIGGGAGLFDKLFGKSEDERYNDRINEAVGYVADLKRRAIQEGGSQITRETSRNIGEARLAAKARAAAEGQEGSSESYVAPAEGKASASGMEALRRYIADTNRAYDEAEINLRTGYATRPLEPDAGDYLLTAGTNLVGIGLQNETLDAYRDAYGAPKAEGENLPGANSLVERRMSVLGSQTPEGYDALYPRRNRNRLPIYGPERQ